MAVIDRKLIKYLAICIYLFNLVVLKEIWFMLFVIWANLWYDA